MVHVSWYNGIYKVGLVHRFSLTSRTMITYSSGSKRKARLEEMYVCSHLWCRRRRKKKVKVFTLGFSIGPKSLCRL